ncbi:acidic amino acid decarboxylase GADL1-like [Uranotaenia lowii]|uniref:acidic amino acid decarboxylase GADL1-like n=1 Tax=Uranotaenia lowii TaxID=190385 RepID=UPI002478DD11|nr:acidic amino acid decarboxylase GADL1-like [Uranotaenia lowii]
MQPAKAEDQDLELLSKIFHLLESERVFKPHKEDKIFPFVPPTELKDLFDLNLENVQPTSAENREATLRKVIQYSIKSNHPNYHHEMFAGPDLCGLAASWITDALNAMQFTFEAAPVFSLIDTAVLQYLLGLCGFPDGEGVSTPGGSVANMYAIAMARHKLMPELKKNGMYNVQKFKIFTSQDAHYSITKSANWLGLGEENVLRIATDDRCRINVDALDRAIAESIDEGCKPLIVSVTAGTTVFGAIDKLDRVADVCQRYKVWMHVDGAWAGAALHSRKYRSLLAGLERADSVSLCPQKIVGVPLQCSMFLMRHRGLLKDCNAACAEYLFPTDKYYDVAYDTGDLSVQCGRKIDSFKFWFMLKARGTDWFEKSVDSALDCAQYFKKAISGNPYFKLVLPEYEFTNICFWFIPKRLQLDPNGGQESDEWWKEIHKVTLALKAKMVKKGNLMVSYTSNHHKRLGYFFRMVIKCVPAPTTERMDFVVQEMIALGADM